jgi:hypothetical protein
MPRKFQTILFWFDGSFTTSLSTGVVNILRPELASSEKIALQHKIRPFQNELAIGQLHLAEFCRNVVEICQAQCDPTALPTRLVETAVLNQSFFDIYRQISPENDPRVIVDIPEIWFRELIRLWKVEDAFPAARLIFCEQSDLQKMLPDIFEYIPRAAGCSMEDCFLVDPQQMRAVAAHKTGLVSTAFVYPRRLKIDLALQGIWKTTEDVYHPKAGARTNI